VEQKPATAEPQNNVSGTERRLENWRWSSTDWRVLIFLSALALVIFLAGLRSFGILDPSDGLYAECTREMLERHNLMTPYFNYQPFYEKPILIYWAIAAAYKAFGVSEWAARLPSALSGVLCVVSLYALSRQWIKRRAATLACLTLLASPLFVVVGHLCLTDMMLTFFVTCATLSLFARFFGGNAGFLLLAYAVLGLAMLAKGPVALVLVGGALCFYLLCRGSDPPVKLHQFWWQSLWSLHPVAGLLLVLAISAPWYIAEYSATHGEFFQEFFIRQNLGRAAGTVNHQNPWYYYIPFLFGGTFPWWLFLAASPQSIVHLWRRRKSSVRAHQLGLLALCWAVLIVGLFSAVRTKLGTYILPAFPPLALLTGIALDYGLRLPSVRKRLLIVSSVLAAVTVAAAVALPFVFSRIHSVSSTTQLAFYLGATLLVCGFSVAVYQFSKRRASSAVYVATTCSALAMAVLIPAGLHQYDEMQHQPFRQLLEICRNDHANVGMFLRDSPAANFYLQRSVPSFASADEVNVFKSTHPGKHYMLVTKDVMKQAQDRVQPLHLIENKGKWYLFSLDQ
jgi:4-amino-4-deoxy-L-arabinose transferase-like glycosyltransferase